MTCREFIEFLMAYLDRELDPLQRDVFEEHVDACPECADYLDSYRQTVEMGKWVCDPEGAVPEDVPEPLIRAILAARRAG